MEEACAEYSVVLSVFSFLEVKDLLGTASLVCKQWSLIAEEPLVHLQTLRQNLIFG